jgi:hypothetical protein
MCETWSQHTWCLFRAWVLVPQKPGCDIMLNKDLKTQTDFDEHSTKVAISNLLEEITRHQAKDEERGKC